MKKKLFARNKPEFKERALLKDYKVLVEKNEFQPHTKDLKITFNGIYWWMLNTTKEEAKQIVLQLIKVWKLDIKELENRMRKDGKG